MDPVCVNGFTYYLVYRTWPRRFYTSLCESAMIFPKILPTSEFVFVEDTDLCRLYLLVVTT